jgi:hypothetical protein
VQPKGAGAVLFGEMPLQPTLREALTLAARDARQALAGEDLSEGLEVVIAFDGSLLWPALHLSAGHILLGVTKGPFPEGDPYADEVAGKLLSSLVPADRLVPIEEGSAAIRSADDFIDRARSLRPKAIGIALRGAVARPGGEREMERALRERIPDVPLLVSCDVAPLWGWSDRPVEKTAVSLALLPLVAEAAAGARAGLADEGLATWFASQDGTLIPSALASRHPYAVMRGLPILSLTAAVTYGRELPGQAPLAAASVHETSMAVARLGARPQGTSLSSAILGARIESLGIGAESPVWVANGRVVVAEDLAPAASVPVRAVLAAAGLVAQAAPQGDAAARALAQWLHKPQEAAVAVALSAVYDRVGKELGLRVAGTSSIVFCGTLAGSIAAPSCRRAGLQSIFLPPAFGACAAVAARTAPRAARSADALPSGERPLAAQEASRILEAQIAVAVGDLEENGLRRGDLAAVAWVSGTKDAHGVFPALDRESIAKAAVGIVRDLGRAVGGTLEVEVYPARGNQAEPFPRLAAPMTAPQGRRVVLEGAASAIELRVVPAGALSPESPTQGPALLSDPTGFILVPEGFEARPAPLGGTELRQR